MGKKVQRIFLIIFAALLCCFSAGCIHKNNATEELSEAEIYERGYDLPIDSAEQEEAEQD